VFGSGNYSKAGQDSVKRADQRKGTLVIHNNTNATLTISANNIKRDLLGLYDPPGKEVEVPPGKRMVLSNFLPRGNVEVTAEARKSRPKVLPISECYWVSGAAKIVREWEIFPEYFGKSLNSDSPNLGVPLPVAQSKKKVDGCIIFSGGYGYTNFALYDHIISQSTFIGEQRRMERLLKFSLWGWSTSFQKKQYEISKNLYKKSYSDLRNLAQGTIEEGCRKIRNMCGINDWRGTPPPCYR